MKLIVPDNNDPELFEAIKTLKIQDSKYSIGSIYGKATSSKYFGSGRANLLFPNISRAELNRKVLALKEHNLEYEYALNGILPKTRLLENRKHIIEELVWLESSSISRIVIANYELAKLVQKYAPSLDIIISTFACVNNEAKILQWSNLSNVRAIVLDRSIYKNLNLLKRLISKATELEIALSLVANLGCMSNCIRTEEHAIIKDLASENKESLFYAPCTFYCLKYLLENPKEFLKLPIIRPEDLQIYEELGIASIKLVDRTQPTSWITEVIESYMVGKYNGNILDLTCNFSKEGIKEMSSKEVASINIRQIIQNPDRVIHYRKILPALMNVSINRDFSFLSCSDNCSECQLGVDCIRSSSVNYDPKRREIVLRQLEDLENHYLF